MTRTQMIDFLNKWYDYKINHRNKHALGEFGRDTDDMRAAFVDHFISSHPKLKIENVRCDDCPFVKKFSAYNCCGHPGPKELWTIYTKTPKWCPLLPSPPKEQTK